MNEILHYVHMLLLLHTKGVVDQGTQVDLDEYCCACTKVLLVNSILAKKYWFQWLIIYWKR